MKVAVVKETYPGERRVALVPANVPKIVKTGVEVIVEAGAGEAAGFPDKRYIEQGAHIAASRDEAFSADIIIQVRALGANLEQGRDDLPHLRQGKTVIGMCDPLGAPEAVREIAETGASMFALELMPRITRAQQMDVLSSMATIAGYRAVLLAAAELPKMFPMVTYAAGMLRPSRIFILGAGVAGLRAIATAKQLGAVVQAHDIRPTSREEVQSVGARFVELKLDADTQDAGGYAKQLTESDYQRQRELIADVAEESDVIITTAAIPGRRSPLLVTADAVKRMAPGSVIIDLAAERGGNCELTKADERVVEHGVTIFGPTNTPSDVPFDASTMYSNNITRFLQCLIKEGELVVDILDEVVGGTLVAHEGQVFNARIRDLLGLEPLEQPQEEPAESVEPPPSDSASDKEMTIPFDDSDDAEDDETSGETDNAYEDEERPS